MNRLDRTLIQLNVVALILFCNYSYSQITIAENTDFSLGSGTLLISSTDLFSSGNIYHRGTIIIDGNWFNDGYYHAGNATLRFSGIEEQTYFNNNYTLQNVELNCSGLVLDDDLLVENQISLFQGRVYTTENYAVRLASGAEIFEGSEESYVAGQIIQYTNSSAFYPVGTQDTYLPAWLSNASDQESEVSIYLSDPIATDQYQDNLRWISEKYRWNISALSGSLEGTLLTLQYDNEDGIIDPGSLVIAGANLNDNFFISKGCSSQSGNSVRGILSSRNDVAGGRATIAELAELVTISNVLTPNNDDINDVLYISNIEEFPENEVIILNKGGQKIYSLHNYQNNWNGSIEGKLLPGGSYVCVVNLRGMNRSYKQIFTVYY